MLILEIGAGRKREEEKGERKEVRAKETEREGRERNIDFLPPPIGAPTGALTHNPLLYGMMLQPAEPPAGAMVVLFSGDLKPSHRAAAHL